MITAQSLSRAALTERRYVWRDPARCSPAQLTALAAHDVHIAALDAMADRGQAAGRPARAVHNGRQQTLRDVRLARFAELRDEGLSVGAAAERLGIARNTASTYERRIRKQAGRPGPQDERARRLARYKQYRAEGLSPADSAVRLGLRPRTARYYERDLAAGQ